MTAKEMWAAFTAQNSIDADYEAWAFGADPDTLADLVARGIKTATASAYPLYVLEGEALPRAGEYSVILNAREEATCVICTTKVYVTPYRAVTPEQAFKEGEGDRSLTYWRQVHEAFFTASMAEAGLTFNEDMEVVCEEFEVVYPAPERPESSAPNF